jgi:hypothetical protein
VSEPKRKSEASTNKGQPTDQARRELSEDERKEIRAFRDRKRDRPRAPNARVKSAPRKPLHLDFPSAVEITRFMSAFGGGAVFPRSRPPFARSFGLRAGRASRAAGRDH